MFQPHHSWHFSQYYRYILISVVIRDYTLYAVCIVLYLHN